MNMGKNELLIQYLEYYITKIGVAEFAVLIKGAWGAGKTWFIKEFIHSLGQKNESISQYYVSLYGLETKEDIDEKIFEAMHPLLGSKTVKIVANIFRAAVKMGIGIKIGETDLSVAPELSEINIDKSKYEKAVLVFDDFERSSIEIETLLGYIGAILCDEEKVKIKYAEKYLNIKEKVIGQTFEIEDNPEDAIAAFIGQYSELSSKTYLYDEILDVYRRLNYKNLRSVKQSIDLFSYLYSVISGTYRLNESLIRDLANVYFTLSLENKAGNLNDISIDDAINIEFAKNLSIAKYKLLSEDEKRKIQEGLIYSYMTYRKKIPLSNLWHEIIHDGKINSAKINDDLYRSFYANEGKNIPILYQLMENWRNLSKIDFAKYYKLLQEEYGNATDYNQGDILHYASICLFFTNNGLIRKKKTLIVEETKKRLRRLYSTSVDAYIEDMFFYSHGYRGYAFSSEPEMKEILLFLNDLNNTYKVMELKNELVSYLNKSSFDFKEILDGFNQYDGKAKFINTPVLGSIDPKIFLKKFCDIESKNKWLFIEELKHRYGSAYGNGVFDNKYATEIPFISSLIKQIKKVFIKESSLFNPKIVELRNIEKELESIMAFIDK
jgi:hypothetical protein